MGLAVSIYRQFARPTGLLGHLAGFIMAQRGSNVARSVWTLDLLDLRPEDRVLEVGFGPGVALQKASDRATRGKLMGIDHSPTMLAQARRRNRVAIAAGRLELRLASVDPLPELGVQLDKVYSVNVVQFWADQAAVFRALRAQMAPRAVIATTYQPRHRGATAGDAEAMGRRIAQALAEARLEQVHQERLPLQPLPAVCVLARVPSG